MVTELNPQDRQHAAGLLNRAGLTFDARDVALVAAAIRQFEIEASARIRAVTPLTDSINSGWELGFKRGHHAAADLVLSGEARQPPAEAPRHALRVVS